MGKETKALEDRSEGETPINLSIFKLSKPLVYEDYNLTEINLKLDSLTAAMSEEADCEYEERGWRPDNSEGTKEADRRYAFLIAVKTSGIPREVLNNLTVDDYYAVVYRTMTFLSKKVSQAVEYLQK